MNHPQAAAIVASLKNDLDELAYQLEVAKTAEAAAREHRIACEEAIIAAVGVKEEGSSTRTTGFYRLTTTGRLTRALDAQKLEEVRAIVPQQIFDQVVKYSPELRLGELRYLELNEPEIYRTLCAAITTKPGKASVKVERLEAK